MVVSSNNAIFFSGKRTSAGESLGGLSLSGVGDGLKQQFTQYLEVLKEKVAEMELKAKESFNEKTFYKQKYEEQEEQVSFLREREKDYSI